MPLWMHSGREKFDRRADRTFPARRSIFAGEEVTPCRQG
jgi:hypothetical protein